MNNKNLLNCACGYINFAYRIDNADRYAGSCLLDALREKTAQSVSFFVIVLRPP